MVQYSLRGHIDVSSNLQRYVWPSDYPGGFFIFEIVELVLFWNKLLY